MEILNDQGVVNPVKGLGEINESHDNSMRLGFVKVSMNKVKESDEIMGGGCSFHPTTICWIKERLDYW